MQITITGFHIDLGDNLRAYAEKTVLERLNKYFVEATAADIRVSKEKSQFKTEILIHPRNGALIQTTSFAGDAYASFDGAINRLTKQLNRYKSRLSEHKIHPEITAPMAIIESDLEKEVSDSPLIIADLTTQIPTCTVGQAVMQMDLSGVSALMFKNEATGIFNMVYRRIDGNISWVSPKE